MVIPVFEIIKDTADGTANFMYPFIELRVLRKTWGVLGGVGLRVPMLGQDCLSGVNF